MNAVVFYARQPLHHSLVDAPGRVYNSPNYVSSTMHRATLNMVQMCVKEGSTSLYHTNV